MSEKKNPAQCVFDLYDLKFGMHRDEVGSVLDFAETGHLKEESLLKAGAEMVVFFFDHEGRLWQVKAYYAIGEFAEAEALLERMSEDYRFQTPTSRVAFEVTDREDGGATLYIRYTEINLKRAYFHHQMAVGAAKIAEEKNLEDPVDGPDDEYIPTGPLIF